VVFHDNGTCTLHYEEYDYYTGAPSGYPRVTEDLVHNGWEIHNQPDLVTSANGWDYCTWALNMRHEPYRLYIDWHLQEAVAFMKERAEWDMNGNQLNDPSWIQFGGILYKDNNDTANATNGTNGTNDTMDDTLDCSLPENFYSHDWCMSVDCSQPEWRNYRECSGDTDCVMTPDHEDC
jgi:hypothetical protein